MLLKNQRNKFDSRRNGCRNCYSPSNTRTCPRCYTQILWQVVREAQHESCLTPRLQGMYLQKKGDIHSGYIHMYHMYSKMTHLRSLKITGHENLASSKYFPVISKKLPDTRILHPVNLCHSFSTKLSFSVFLSTFFLTKNNRKLVSDTGCPELFSDFVVFSEQITGRPALCPIFGCFQNLPNFQKML